ncbi:MAG: hypothetical protein IPM39_27380 [Chloroflexi bacterium]|nr:hypothetical protein [Chloroflexota bacterium]
MKRSDVTKQINTGLYHGRMVAAALSLLFVGYCLIYIWWGNPPGAPLMIWYTDSRSVIHNAHHTHPESPLQVGDVVVAIEGQAIRRMSPFFPLPHQDAYTFLVQRDGETLSLLVPVSGSFDERFVWFLAPSSLLAVVGWLVGSLMLFLVQRENRQALHTGYIFLLSASVLIGIQASLSGTPGAWVTGHVMIYFLAVGWVYLGFLPRVDQLSGRARQTLGVLLLLASLLAALAAYEVLVLFPQPTSFEEIVGISLYDLSFLAMAASLITCVVILFWRVLRLPPASYLRQQLWILLFFFLLGVFPTMLLTIVPKALADVTLLSFPVAIALMIFIPVGYLFVIYRKGFLGLDLFFSRALHLLVLTMGIGCLYALTLYLGRHWLGLETAGGGVIQSTVVFVPALLFALYANRPMSQSMQRLLYGRIAGEQERLVEFATDLSNHPEFETIEQVATSVARILGSNRVMMILKDEQGDLRPIVGETTMDLIAQAQLILPTLTAPLVRTALHPQSHPLLSLFDWTELIVPITVRGEAVGLLALGRPNIDGYFNFGQVTFVARVARILAVASENIYLFEATRWLGRRIMLVREQERKRIAQEIHDDPLQRMFFITNLLDKIRTTPGDWNRQQVVADLGRGIDELLLTGDTLRGICLGLYPPVLEQELPMAVNSVVRQFRQDYGLPVTVEVTGDASVVPVDLIMPVCHIITESLHNVVKHAAANSAFVTLVWDDEMLLLEVVDDGRGTAAAGLSVNDLIRRRCMGIVGMHERAHSVGGDLQVMENTPRGTHVLLRCPLPPDPSRKTFVGASGDEAMLGGMYE